MATTLSSAVRRGPLSAEEIARYHDDGQLTPAWRLSDALLVRMQAALERLVEARPNVRPDFIALPHVPWDGPGGVDIAREFFEFVTRPDLLDLVEQVIGPDIVLWASAVFCKPAGTGLEVPWHQDGQYWPIRPRATVTAWIALDDVGVDNGCMRVIPGSHRRGEFSHEVSDREDLVLNNVLNDPRLDLAALRNVELEAGQLSLHHVDIVHGSQPNTSGRRRAGFAIRYMPAAAHYDRGIAMGGASVTAPVEFKERPIWLVRGVDRCGQNDFSVGHTHW
ncbi:MAG: phytanoyl-CoA dioxygenase family protein [Gammaproteobacteria bacterium]|nr:phytanoyl-CoA dioxygenase family protein [Gammaproteobacteria bacterium]